MKRRLFTVAAAVSALICATTLALWALSYRQEAGLRWRSSDFANNHSRNRYALITSTPGRIWIEAARDELTIVPGSYAGPASGSWSGFTRFFGPARPPRYVDNLFWENSGFAFEAFWKRPTAGGNYTGIESRITLILPHWFVALISVILPDLWWRGKRRRLRQYRRANNLCEACGYDLRATPEKGGALLARCPECGSEAKSQPAVSPAA